MKTTLNKIRNKSPCGSGWENLLRSLGKTGADDAELSIAQIVESNGIDDALWCFCAVDGYEKEKRLFAVWCSRRVEHLNADERVKAANDAAEMFANSEISDAAMDAAWAAASAAASAAARAAARATAWDAGDVGYAAWAAASAAASAAAWDAKTTAGAAAWAAAKGAHKQMLLYICEQIITSEPIDWEMDF